VAPPPQCRLRLGSDRVRCRQVLGNRDVVALPVQIETGGMLEPVQLPTDVEDDVVTPVRGWSGWDVVQIEGEPKLPGDDMVVQEVSPLTPSPPTSVPSDVYSANPPPKTLIPPIRLPIIGSLVVP
jgi:hypothetical protein